MPNEQPLISIIIPVYNGSDFMIEAIESALNQTYSNIETIVVNDGSNDGGKTEAIALSYGDRIRYFSKPNGGVSTAVNYGLMQMRGEWFVWLSHDDLLASNRLALDVQIMQKQSEAKVIFCRINKINAAGQIIEAIRYPIEHVTGPHDVLTLRGVYMCSLTIHRDCLNATGLFNESNRTTQDTEMSLRLSSFYPFYFNPTIGVFVREHPNRVFYRLNALHLRDQLRIAQLIHDELTISAFFSNFSNIAKSEKIKAWIWMGSQYLSFGERNYAHEAFVNALAACSSFWEKTLTKLKIVTIWMMKTLLNTRIRGYLKSVRERLK